MTLSSFGTTLVDLVEGIPENFTDDREALRVGNQATLAFALLPCS
jgi:hypothetical protein